jgi:thioredoxin reductase (NADPH)
MYDVIVLGKGPAGIQAALYVKRANLSVLIIAKDKGALLKSDKIANYYGVGTLSGEQLVDAGVDQAKDLGIEIVDGEVTGVSQETDASFNVDTIQSKYQGKSVIIATGSPRTTLKIPGISKLEGKGVSYCAVCDAFFYRNKHVGLIGNGAYALHEAQELLPLVGELTLFTNGLTREVDFPANIKVITHKIDQVVGEDTLESILLSDGKTIALEGLFIALGSASSTDLALKLGALTEGNKILVDEKQHTNVPGLFAAGDCTPGTMQIAKAVGDGMTAGLEAIIYIRSKK